MPEIEDASPDQSDLDIIQNGADNATKSNNVSGEDVTTDESGGEDLSDTPSEEESEDEQKADGEEKPETIEQPNLFKGLKAKYPEIFKEFPELRKEIALAQQITSVYPTVEAAKEAQQALQGFDLIRDAALTGDSKTILSEIAKADEGAAVKFATSFMPMLKQNAPQLYAQAATPIVKQLLTEIRNIGYQRYKASEGKDSDLYYAVGHISNQLFGQPTIPEDQAPDPEIENKKAELSKREQQFNSSIQGKFERNITSSAESQLTTIIGKGLDPENVLPARMKDAIIGDVAKEVKDILRSDKRYLATMESLFRNASASDYSPDASDKIINAFLARVKPLIGPARDKVRSEYLQDKRSNVSGNNKPKKQFIPSSGSNGNQNKSLDPKKIDYRNTSDLDILSGKISYKR